MAIRPQRWRIVLAPLDVLQGWTSEAMIVALDTQVLGPGKHRAALADQSVATGATSLVARSTAARMIPVIWRAVLPEAAIQRDGPGRQVIARLRIGG